MGCGPSKSKIKTINLPPEDTVETVSGALNGRPVTAKSKHGNNNSSVGPDETTLPNKLLSAAIPVSDLGESLDSRVLGESLNFRYRVPCQVGDNILLTLIWQLRCLPYFAWPAADLAEVACHVGNMVELPN